MNSNGNNMSFSDCFKEAKQRLLIPELWKKLDLPGEPSKRCKSPFRDESKPSFSISRGGAYFKDHGSGACGDIFDFYRVATDCDKAEAARAIFAMLNLSAENPEYGWSKPPKKPEVVSLPKVEPPPCHEFYQCRLPEEAYPFFLSKGINPASAMERMMEGSLDVEAEKLVFVYPTGKKMRCSWESSRDNRWIEGGADDALWRYEQVLRPEVDTVFITEGESDCMKVLSTIDPPLNVAVVAAPASSWRPSNVLAGTIGHGRKVVLAFDNDEAGATGVERVSDILWGACDTRVIIESFPWKQVDGMLRVLGAEPVKDLCELPQSILRKALDRCFN